MVLILHVGGICGWSAALEKNKGQGNFGSRYINFDREKNKNFSWIGIFVENMLTYENSNLQGLSLYPNMYIFLSVRCY